MEFLRKVEWRNTLKSYGKLRVKTFLGFQLETGGRINKSKIDSNFLNLNSHALIFRFCDFFSDTSREHFLVYH